MANQIVRGTTPSFIYKCNTIDVSDISEAYLTLMQWNEVKVEKDQTSATIDTTENTLTWTLTQAETLALVTTKSVTAHCKWKLQDGTVGEAVQLQVGVVQTGKDEVI